MKYSAMILLLWIPLLSILVPGAAEIVSTKACNTTADSLYIIMDSSRDPDLTFRRIARMFQFFISKRDRSANNPIYLIEPFQQKVFSCSNVSSDGEIDVYLDQFKHSINVNKSSGNSISTLSEALTLTNGILQSHYAAYNREQSILMAWFSGCYVNCQETVQLFEDYTFDIDAKQFLLFLPWPVRASREIRRMFDRNKFLYLLDPYDDLSDSVIIALYGCIDCPNGWIYLMLDSYNSIFYCYKTDILRTKMNWIDASAYCRSMFSELPTIETDEELNLLITALSNATIYKPFDQVERFAVHVGLTKTSDENEGLQWNNKRPFTLRNSFQRSSSDDPKCMVLKLSFSARENDESIRENVGIAWELVDCKINKTYFVLCKSSIKLKKNRGVERIYLKSQALQETMSLNKEFNLDKNIWALLSVVHRFMVLGTDTKTEYEQLLFDCEDGLNAIVYSKVCNYFIDCDNGRDEAYCGVTNNVKNNDFFCVNPNANQQFPYAQTIPHNLKCNVHQDCPDNSDELGCDECTGRRCSDGTCVPRHWLSSDEEECWLHKYSNGTMFINITVERFRLPTQQHEVVRCKVIESAYQNTGLNANTETDNWAPKCLFHRGRSGRPIGCNDMSHLQGCMDFKCDDEFTKCHKSYCIPWHLINDGLMDCPHGEDEDVNGVQFSGTRFICNSDTMNYIHPVHVCDGVVQCPHGDDELNCNVTCPPGFKCFGSAVMVNNISEVEQIKSFRIFDIQTKYLKVSGLDLSQLNELYILPNLLELHASHCNLESLKYILGYQMKLSVYYLDLSYNNFTLVREHFYYDELKYLQFLNLTGNIYLSAFNLNLPSLNRLKKLDLSFTNVSTLPDETNIISSTLRYLNVANTKIETLKGLYSDKMNSLDFLDIRNTCLNDSDTVNLLKKLTITSALYVDNFIYCCPQVVGTGISKHVCHAPFDGISSCDDLIGDILKRSLLWLAALMSLVGNIMVLAFRIHYDRGMLKKGYGVFVTNLGLADFIMGVYMTIIASMDIYFRDNYVLHETDWRDSILCKISGFLSTLSSETSTFFVLLITLERFLVIRFPFGEYRLTTLTLIILVVASWIIGFTLAFIPILFPQWTIYSSNGMCIGLPLTTDRQHGWQYPFGVFIGFNFICFLVIAFGQILIFISMSNQRFIVTTPNATRRQQDINVAKQLFIVAMSNFLCWFPICITGLMSLNGYKVSPDSHAWFVIFVLPLNAAINPMIYTIPAIFKK